MYSSWPWPSSTIVLLNFVASAATARQCARSGRSAADGATPLPPSDEFPDLGDSRPADVRGRRPYSSPLWRARRRPVNVHGVAVVPQTAQPRFHHRTIAQKVRPLVIHQIRCNDRGMLSVALLHQLEEDVRLLRFQI